MKKNQRTADYKIRTRILSAGILAAGLILGLGGCTGGSGNGGNESTKEDPSNPVTLPSGEEESTTQVPEEKTKATYLGTNPKTTVDPGVDMIGADYTWENGELTVLPYQSKFLIVETPLLWEPEAEPGPGDLESEDGGAQDPLSTQGVEDPADVQTDEAMVRFFDIETGTLSGKKFSGFTVLPEKTVIFDDGSIGLGQKGLCSYLWLDQELEETGSFDFETWKKENPSYEDLGMYRIDLRTDRKGGYFAWNNAVYYLDMEQQTLTDLKIEIEAPDGVYISEILYDNTVLQLLGYNGQRVTYYDYDITTPDQAVLKSQSTIDARLFTEDQTYVGVYINTDFDEKRLFSGTYGDSEMVWCDVPESVSVGSGFYGGNGLISLSMDEEKKLAYIDLKEGDLSARKMAPYCDDNGYFTFYGAMDYGDYECYVTYRDDQGTKFKIYLVDLDRDTEDLGEVEVHHVTMEDHSDEEFIRLTGITDPSLYAVDVLKTKYESMDEYAQAMSYKYGVQVVYGDAIEEFNEMVPDFEVTTLIPDDGTWGTLAKLDRVLSNYPEGFFKQLRTDMTPDGVVICLAAGLTGKDGYETVNSADGLATENLNTHLVYLNVYSASFEQNIYHEFSHVIDHYIENQKFMVADDLFFTEEEWNSYNPEGFLYEENYDSYNDAEEGIGSEYNVYGYRNGEIGMDDVYFIDYYATLYPTEDRARIMEYACSFRTEDYMQSPHIQGKVRYMSEYIRHYFDDSTWPEVLPWEKCLSVTQ